MATTLAVRLPLIRFLSGSLFVAFCLFAVRSYAGSSNANAQRTDIANIDLPAMPGGGDAIAQYKRACAVLFDAHGAPDYDSALRLLRSSASLHFAPAEFLLGYLYEHGRGVAVDYGKAAEYYRAAAQGGDAGAENNLGGMYEYGRGVAKDVYTAFKWFSAAAQHGNAMGQYNLGTFYQLGYGTAVDLGRSAQWFRAAADQGLAVAEANLAICYFKGRGVPVDYALAAHWSQLAAEQGLPHAAMNYAYLCEHGMGVARDELAAYVWYSRAVVGGDKLGAGHVKALARHLSKAQKEQASSELAAMAKKPAAGGMTAAEGDVTLIENP
ncbi:MAG: tetratricopeptide repeat protein [Candidatus Acidiferrum sp.]